MSGPITWFDAVLLWCGYSILAGAVLLGTLLALAVMVDYGARKMFFTGEIVAAIMHLRDKRAREKSWAPMEDRSNPPPPKTPRPVDP